jgi:protein-S-isoprenylcysteine O-methyltransferase Ste14
MRKSIRNDILFFGIPALVVFCLGLIVSGLDGYDGLVGAMWKLATDAQSRSEATVWNIAGLAIFVVGLTIAIVAASTLKRNYVSTLMTRDDHELITHGLYRHVRHPLYFGVLIAIMGVPVYAPSLPGFGVMCVLIPIFLNRIRMEEAMLTEKFGDAYEAYRKATRKLIPFVY